MTDKKILLPSSLTAENGAKKTMIGEFTEMVSVICPECLGHNKHEDCDLCYGSGEITQEVNISWNNIKAIYRAAVDLLGVQTR